MITTKHTITENNNNNKKNQMNMYTNKEEKLNSNFRNVHKTREFPFAC